MIFDYGEHREDNYQQYSARKRQQQFIRAAESANISRTDQERDVIYSHVSKVSNKCKLARILIIKCINNHYLLLNFLIQAVKPYPKAHVNKGKKKRLVFTSQEEIKQSEKARKNYEDRRSKINGLRTQKTIRKVTTQSYSPTKIKKRKRTIITGASPVKISRMGHQNSVPLKKEPSLDLDLIEVKLFLQSSCFAQLEETIQLFDGLVVIRQEDTKKFDIESERGQKS